MSRGHDRERLVRELLELGFGPYGSAPLQPWWVSRAAGSLGDADLVAAQVDDGGETDLLLVEVKSDAVELGPFNNFGPVRRERLRHAAALAGGTAWLCWVPPTPKGIKGVHGCWIPEAAWPLSDRRIK